MDYVYSFTLIPFLFVIAVRASPEPRRAPALVEPPHHVEFTNETGLVLSCATRGEYQVSFTEVDFLILKKIMKVFLC